MSFVKRILNIEILGKYFHEDQINGIGKALRGADSLIIRDEESAEIINLWRSGNTDLARNKLTNVLRISSTPRTDN